MFRTPRLLLEAQIKGKWQPIKIYCNYPNVRPFIDALPRIAVSFGGMDFVRIRRLKSHSEIAAAKLSCYKYRDQLRRKRK